MSGFVNLQASLELESRLRASARASGFRRYARYISVCFDGVNFVAPFVPTPAFAAWVESNGGQFDASVSVAWWSVGAPSSTSCGV